MQRCPLDVASRRGLQASKGFEQRGLADPVRALQIADFASVQGEGKIADQHAITAFDAEVIGT
jgi:hypothetical protein